MCICEPWLYIDEKVVTGQNAELGRRLLFFIRDDKNG